MAERDAENPVDELDVPVRFGLGGLSLPFRKLQAVQPGFIFSLEGTAADLVRIEVNGTLIGRGELVLVDGRPGVRVTERCDDGNDEPA